MDIRKKYPMHDQIIDHPGDLDGYVAATHEANSISANAFELRDRKTNKALAPAEAYQSESLSSQQRGILRGIIALLQMSSEGSSLYVYTTLQTVAEAIAGRQRLKVNSGLLEEIRRIESEKGISLRCFYCAEHDERRLILDGLLQLAQTARKKNASR